MKNVFPNAGYEHLIGAWLEQQHEGYTVSGVVTGTYGLVWILAASRSNIYPRGFAGKGLNLPTSKSLIETRQLFEREIGLWMKIPAHFNVVRALGIDFVPSNANTLLSAAILRLAAAKPNELEKWWRAAEEQWRQVIDDETSPLPIVRMPLFDGSLRDWINGSGAVETESPAREREALKAIGQLCNGLRWLYGHGVTGHGDLKPENVLYKKDREEPSLSAIPPEEILIPRVAIADLGWADAWNALGLTERAWRPYLAPERTNPGFDASRSDVFAMAVIFVELLTGKHPAGEPTERVAKWRRSRWFEWAASGERKLDAIEDISLRSFLADCLAPTPPSRPSPGEILAFVASHADKKYGIPLGKWLDALDREAEKDEYLHPGWAFEEIAKVSKEMREHAIRDLRQRLSIADSPSSPNSKAEAVWLVRSFAQLLSRGDDPNEWREAYERVVSTCRAVLDEFHSVDWRKAVLVTPAGTSSEQTAVWILTELMSSLRDLAGDELPEIGELRHRILQREREIEGSL